VNWLHSKCTWLTSYAKKQKTRFQISADQKYELATYSILAHLAHFQDYWITKTNLGVSGVQSSARLQTSGAHLNHQGEVCRSLLPSTCACLSGVPGTHLIVPWYALLGRQLSQLSSALFNSQPCTHPFSSLLSSFAPTLMNKYMIIWSTQVPAPASRHSYRAEAGTVNLRRTLLPPPSPFPHHHVLLKGPFEQKKPIRSHLVSACMLQSRPTP